jgi:hypothetical protein
MLQLPVPVYRNRRGGALSAAVFRAGWSGLKHCALTLELGGRQTLDRPRHLRLLFMAGRAIQAVLRQNREPNWIAYMGVQIRIGPIEAVDNGTRAASEDRSNTH